MKTRITKKELFYNELSKQIDFSKNVYSLNSNDVRILETSAKAYGYRCKDNGSQIACILHARFYCMLQNMYYKQLNNKDHENRL